MEYVDPATGQAFAGGNPRRTRHIYAGLETIQDYTCSAAGTGCDGASPNYTLARQFLWGSEATEEGALTGIFDELRLLARMPRDPAKFPDPVGMLDHRGRVARATRLWRAGCCRRGRGRIIT